MWDCCGYTLDRYVSFVTEHLMPRMKADHPALRFLVFDHNPDAIEEWVRAAYDNPELREWAWGAAVHWYSEASRRGVALNNTHKQAPDKPILHTEGCVCRDLPSPSSPGWWGVGEQYGVGLMQYLQNWAVGFTDWNLVLDAQGGPSHDRRFGCNAPLMACPPNQPHCQPGSVVYQAPFFHLAHFSKFLPPGSVVVGAMVYGQGEDLGETPAPTGSFFYPVGAEGAGGSLAVLAALQPNGTTVVIALNTGDDVVTYALRDPRVQVASEGARVSAQATITIPSHSIQTLQYNV